MPAQLYWLIFLLPVASFGLISVVLKPFVSNDSKSPGYLTILCYRRFVCALLSGAGKSRRRAGALD